MRIFSFDGSVIDVTAEALSIPEIAEVYFRDKSKGKITAIKELTWIYLKNCPCPENGYYLYPEEQRGSKLKNDLFGKNTWHPDDVVLKAEQAYIKILEQIPAIRMLRTFRKALDDAEKFIKGIDLNERDSKGRPIWKPKDIYDALDKLESAYNKLSKIEKDVYKEYENQGRIRGGYKKGAYED